MRHALPGTAKYEKQVECALMAECTVCQNLTNTVYTETRRGIVSLRGHSGSKFFAAKITLVLFHYGQRYLRSFNAARVWRVRHCHVTGGERESEREKDWGGEREKEGKKNRERCYHHSPPPQRKVPSFPPSALFSQTHVPRFRSLCPQLSFLCFSFVYHRQNLPRMQRICYIYAYVYMVFDHCIPSYTQQCTFPLLLPSEVRKAENNAHI